MIACVHIPYFAVALERLRTVKLQSAPILLIHYDKRGGKVVALSRQAEELGVSLGMSVTRARALCPLGNFITSEADRFTGTLERLLALLWTYTNRVEIDESVFPHTLIAYLDLGRLNEDAAKGLIESAMDELLSKLHFSASAGMASGKFPARLAALKAESGKIINVPRGSETPFVAPFHVEMLPLSKEMAQKLNLLAIRRIAEFAVLPRNAVIGQFGKAGKAIYLLAQGMDGSSIIPRRMPPSEAARQVFDPPIEERARLDIALHLLADELALRLEARGSALHRLQVTLAFEQGVSRSEELFLLEPVATARGIAESIHHLVERIPTTSGITLIEVCLAHLVSAAPRQLELFRDQPARTALIDLARVLKERYGDHCYQAELRDRSAILLERRFALKRMDAS